MHANALGAQIPAARYRVANSSAAFTGPMKIVVFDDHLGAVVGHREKVPPPDVIKGSRSSPCG